MPISNTLQTANQYLVCKFNHQQLQDPSLQMQLGTFRYLPYTQPNGSLWLTTKSMLGCRSQNGTFDVFWRATISSELMSPKLGQPNSIEEYVKYPPLRSSMESLDCSIQKELLNIADVHHDRHKTAAILEMNDCQERDLMDALSDLDGIPSEELVNQIKAVDDLSSDQLDQLLSDSQNGIKADLLG